MTLKALLPGLIAAGVLAAAVPALADGPAPAPALVNQNAALKASKTLKVTSAEFANGAAIPLENSGYGASRSPSVKIGGAPTGTKSFAVLMEDADAQKEGAPILHWFVYDLAAKTPAIPAGIPAGAELAQPVSLRQGPNISGQNAYRGPHPPQPAKGPHHYHLEVFALDIVLPTVANRAELATAMTGHVLAQGELIGAFTAPPAAPAAPAG